MTPAQVFFCEFGKILKNTILQEIRERLLLNQLGSSLEEDEKYENHFSIIPECFDELFELWTDDVRKKITNMRVTSTPKLKLTAKIFHVHSFVVLFLYRFPRIC